MIDTRSKFYYGFAINANPYNGNMNIDEGIGEVTFSIAVGSYTLSTLVNALRTTLLAQGTLNYEVFVDRQTRRITISADQNFDLLTNTGQNRASSVWELIGFDTTQDLTGASSYTSSGPAGREYVPQFFLQSYVSKEDFQAKQQSRKNVASNGTTVEVISFGIAKFIEFDIKFITSRVDISDGVNILHNPNGLEDARDFFQDITGLSEFEFMPNSDQAGDFSRCILESMPGFADGTGYKLKELFSSNLRDIYETGIIKLRVVE